MRGNKFVLGTLAGIAIGAVVGILMAPDKGSETRRKISRKGTQYTGDLKGRIGGLKDKYNDVVDGVTSKLESLVGSEGGNMGSTATSGAGGNSTSGNNSGGSSNGGDQKSQNGQTSGAKTQSAGGNAGTM
ncbi:MAG TPA: YtxH domain-containing protein [Flavobacterium sp.]|jgi:gas vesicle protein